MKEVNNQNLWHFELDSKESMNFSLWMIEIFEQRDTKVSQDLNKDTLCILPVTSAQCITGTEKNPDAAILLNFVDDD